LAGGKEWSAANIGNIRKDRDAASGQNRASPKRTMTTQRNHRVTARIGPDFVAQLAHIRDMNRAALRVRADSGYNAHVFHYVRRSKRLRPAA